MSKYDPLRRFLENRDADQTPMTFAEVERILDRPLPPSARRHAGWWSNNPGTHVGVGAWRDAGCKATQVDIGAEKLVFVRTGRDSSRGEKQSDPFDPRGASLAVDLDRFSVAGRRLINDYAAELDGDMGAALARAVHEAAVARRGRLIDQWIARAPRMPAGAPDSVDLVREDRDAR